MSPANFDAQETGARVLGQALLPDLPRPSVVLGRVTVKHLVAAEIVVVLIELDFRLSLICLTFPHAVEGEHDLNQGPAAGFAGALIDAPII